MANYYGPANPFIGNPGGGTTSNTSGTVNPNGNYQSPGYSGFNNFQRLPIPSVIPGRLVHNLDEITPQEVPMDGSVSLFPQNDYSAIYAKTWTKDGTIATVKFIPEQSQTAAPQKSPIEERLDKIDQRFDRLEKMLSNRNKPRKPYNKPNQGKEEQSNA